MRQAEHDRGRGPSRREWTERELPWILLAIAIVVALLVNIALRPQFIHPDCAALVYEGSLLLEGQVPYVDFVETNPPLILYLNAIPAALARGTGMPLAPAFTLFAVALVALSMFAVWGVMRRSPVLDPFERGALMVAWGFVSAMIYMGGEFGQREHLFVLGFFPWLMLRLARAEGGNASVFLAIPVGIAAALACSLKPFYLPALVFVEVALAMRGESLKGVWKNLFSAENLAAAAVGLLYAAHWLVVPAAMRAAYLGYWVPLIARKYAAYGVMNRSDLFFPAEQGGFLAFYTLWIFAWIGLRRPHGLFRLMGLLAGLYYIACLAYVWQNKGWHYHRLPMTVFLTMTLVLPVLQIRRLLASPEGSRAPALSLQRAMAISGLILLLPLSIFPLRNTRARNLGKHYDIIMKESGPGDSVLVVSTNVYDEFPAIVQAGRRHATRYVCAFPLAFAYHETPSAKTYHAAGARPEIERRYLADLAADTAARQPSLILIPDGPIVALPGWFKMSDYLTQSGWIAAALGGYEKIAPPPGFIAYRRRIATP